MIRLVLLFIHLGKFYKFWLQNNCSSKELNNRNGATREDREKHACFKSISFAAVQACLTLKLGSRKKIEYLG